MAKYPAVAVGMRITADLLDSMIPYYAVKTAVETVDSITFQDDDQLTVPVAANGQYEMFIVLSTQSPSADDFKCRLTVPTGTTITGITHGLTTGATGGANDQIANVVATGELDFGTLGTGIQMVEMTIIVDVSSTAGNVTVQWAKQVDTSTGASVLTDSYMRSRQIA